MAVTANQLIKQQAGKKRSYPVAASTHIYGGTFVFVNAAGYADDDTATGVNGFAGVANAEVNNAVAVDGAEEIEVLTDIDIEVTGTGFAQTDVGMPIYADDNYATVVALGSTSVRIGTVVRYISSTKCIVAIKPSGVGALEVAPLTALTHTAPGTPDYAIQDLINSNAYGFVSKDEGNTVLSVVKNLQTRVANLEARLN